MRHQSVCVIACSASKALTAMPARHLYTGDLFRKSLRWAEASRRFDAIKVLSAKHGLVDIEQMIKPYDTALHAMEFTARRAWAASVAHALVQQLADRAEVVALAGQLYTEGLALHLQVLAPTVAFNRPLAGMGIGEQKAWLKRQLDEGRAL